MNVFHYVGIVAIVGIGLAVAPAVNAQSTHGAFAVRLGVGVPLDNNMRDWKNADVISGFSYFMNHSGYIDDDGCRCRYPAAHKAWE